MKQVLSILVENQAGVLTKITSLFARRAFNIDSLAVGVTEDKTVSRITVVADTGNHSIDQIEKQLNKLVSVIKVRRIEELELLGKELAIFKVSSNNKNRSEIKTLCDIMGAKIEDISATTMTVELSDTPDQINLFEDMLRPFSIREVARTGLIAVQKGSNFIG